MTQPYCPACYPNKIRSHAGIRLQAYLDILFQDFFSKKAVAQLPRFPKWFSAAHFWYKLMEMLGVVRFTAQFDRTEHWPRSWAIIAEARTRRISIESIKLLGRVSTYYRVKFGGKRYYFDAVASRFLNFHLDDKAWTKKRLLQAGFPASPGKVFWSAKHGRWFGKKLGFPLAVKPARGTHAYHVSAPVRTAEELARAINLAKQYDPRFIVERFLIGNLYRVTVINFNQVFVARREAPNVSGDGAHTVRELVKLKNTDPRRGETGQRDTTLHKIPLPPLNLPLKKGEKEGVTTTEIALTAQGLTLDHVPAPGEKIILHSKPSIGSGGDIYEETPLLHPENREMFRRAARIFGTDLVGFDMIAEDLNRPYHEQNCGIIEANSIPMLDFHHYPTQGAPQNAAGALWDGIIADKRVRYVYPLMLPQRSLWTRLLWHFLDVAVPLVRDWVLRFAMTHKFLRRQRFHVGWIKPEVAPETAVAHLKMIGFEVVRPEWIDQGEITGLRKLLDHEKQCHIRFFEDGEVRAHVEYAPEARPIAHLLEQGFHAAHDIVHEFLHEFIERRTHHGVAAKSRS
ncbi:hypothetical protein HYW17_04995 [Candidatus Uhrbacteria bacterium]|nr:hypothetical protein [Candidatus Uhrbacteria bacterium]